MGWEEKAAKAKKGHRPSLKNWERDGLAHTFPPYAEALLNSKLPYRSFKIVGDQVVERSLPLECVRNSELRKVVGGKTTNRDSGGYGNNYHGDGDSSEVMYPIVLNAAETPPREFHQRYEAKCIPVVIRNIPYGASATSSGITGDRSMMSDRNADHNNSMIEEEKKECDNNNGHRHQNYNSIGNINDNGNNNYQTFQRKEWPAVRRWTLDALSSDPDLSDRPLKCGEDDDGYTIRMKLKYFMQYLRHNCDDSPLYIFDATFDEDKLAKRILEDYTVPEYFDEDLLGLVGERRRPPYRWFLVGPCRSGTTVHIDPLGTSAWNTLVHGVKRWVLFPPHVPKSVVKGRRLTLPGEDDEAIHYFTTILPRLKRRAAAAAKEGRKKGGSCDYADFECYEFTQYAGETVFVPHGWWHAVLNVTHTVGITQNYCSRRNFDEVWTRTRSGRKKMSCTWLRRLRDRYPDLAARARDLNRRDGYVMWEDDPVEQKKWRRKRAEKERKKGEKKEKKERERESKKAKRNHSNKKKDKWGEHRTIERRKEDDRSTLMDDQDVVMREILPGC